MSQVHTLDLEFLGHKHTIGCFLIKAAPPNSGDILIECGPYSTIEKLKKELKRCGSSIDQIAHVFLTHIHLDHAGAAWALAEREAKIYVHPAGLIHLADPSTLMQSAGRLYGEDMDRLWSTVRPVSHEKLVAVADGAQFFIAGHCIQGYYSPGHAKHHITWRFEDKYFAGDVAGISIKGGPAIPPCPPPDIDIEAWKSSLKALRAAKPTQLYLTHFGCIQDNVNEHLNEVSKRLDSFVKWFQKHDAEAEQAFPLYIKEIFHQAELTEAQIHAYEKANPLFMSVKGLRRFLQKRAQRSY